MKLDRLLIFLFVPILFAIFINGNYSFLIFTEVVICFSIYEFYTMLIRNGKKVYKYAGFIISAIIPIMVYFKLANAQEIILISLLILAILQILHNSISKATEKLALTFFGITYIPLLFSYIIKLKQFHNGGILITFAFILIWSCDTMAYIFGVSFGKHKFSKISPNKSIEGLIGGYLGVFIAVTFFDKIIYFITYILSKLPYLQISIHRISYTKFLSKESFILSLLVTIFCVFGDLFESKIKREYSIKDSGKILLGHGGFLDRFDSALFVIPLIYFLGVIYGI